MRKAPLTSHRTLKRRRLQRYLSDQPEQVRSAGSFRIRATVKADAAHRVFDIDTTGIVFAVIDGGVDATHPAFLKRSNEELKKALKNEAEPTSDVCLKCLG